MSNKTVIIRCRADNTIGFGHLVRSRVLGKKLLELGYKTILIGPSKKYMNDDDKAIFTEWIERESWLDSPTEAKFHIELAKTYGTKHIIMDDYRSDYTHQLLLRKAGLRILQQYDASKPQKFAANLVINGSPYERREFYEQDLYSKDIQMLHGPQYAILRPEFFSPHLDTIIKENKVLITFGGGDDKGAMLHVLSELRGRIPKNWNLCLVMGSHNPNIQKIKDWIKQYPDENIILLVNPSNMHEVIASCKLAILSGGTTTFEAAFLGTPAILMPIAENQYNQSKGWENSGAMIYLSPYKSLRLNELRDKLLLLVENQTKIDKMSTIARQCMDGQGTERILNILLNKGIES
jgi:UDP-2,4-diacetamido-2,4,6-trideoxy-beta-L-altropyranose hydrolase